MRLAFADQHGVLLILDEVNVVADFGLVPVEEVLELQAAAERLARWRRVAITAGEL